jgi:hypothetical protein
VELPRVKRYLEFVDAMTKGDSNTLAAMINPECFVAYLPGSPYEGIDFSLFMQELDKLRQAFPDFARHRDYDNFMLCGHDVVVALLMEMKHEGTLAWHGHPAVEATGLAVGWYLVDVVSFNDDDRVTEFRMSGDRLSVIEQLRA